MHAQSTQIAGSADLSLSHFERGQRHAATGLPLCNPYLPGTYRHREFARGYNTAPIYGVAPVARTRRDDATSIDGEDAIRVLHAPAQWGLPTRAVAWFHDSNARLYAICAEWDIAHLGTTRRVEKRWCADGRWRQTTTWIDRDQGGKPQ